MRELETLIRERASHFSYANNSDVHTKVCYNIIRLMEEYSVPVTIILYLAVGTSAHKINVFNQGYKVFNGEKASKVLTLTKFIEKKLNANKSLKKTFYKNDKLVHTISRYYDLTMGNMALLKRCLTKDKTDTLYQYLCQQNIRAKNIGQIMFGDMAEFNERNGEKTYIINFK